GNNILYSPGLLRYHNVTMNAQTFPNTLQEAIVYFSDPENCITFLAQLRWPNGVTCPNCDAKEVSYLSTRRIWKCKACKKQFSVKVGTIMEDSPIRLDKWLSAIWIIVNAKNGVSSYEIHRSLGITQKSAWFMLHRIRCAMQTGTFKKLSGHVEVDETFIGGKARNMHKHVRERKIKGTGGVGKVAVMGLLERHGEVRAMVIPNIRRQALHTEVKQNVEQGSSVYSDGLPSYEQLGADYVHNVINHAEEYVRGNVHTNGIENFWSLLKRSIRGTYVSVEPFHLFRYLDEQTFRFNSRGGKDADRFLLAARSLVGKRLTFNELIGKDLRNFETYH
ncbi:MAG: IS1595 family transposase, partial [Nitrososphaera sp.]|nr:IS1595 family transposase [Nitrososphaera sp.]